METFSLPDFVKNLNFDQILSFIEDSEKIQLDQDIEKNVKDFNVFQNFIFNDEDNVPSSSDANVCDSSAGQEYGREVVKYPLHIKHGVINFSLTKIIENSEAINDDVLKQEIDIHNKCSDTQDNVQKPLCTICSKPALKYSSYGGLACTSCR